MPVLDRTQAKEADQPEPEPEPEPSNFTLAQKICMFLSQLMHVQDTITNAVCVYMHGCVCVGVRVRDLNKRQFCGKLTWQLSRIHFMQVSLSSSIGTEVMQFCGFQICHALDISSNQILFVDFCNIYNGNSLK